MWGELCLFLLDIYRLFKLLILVYTVNIALNNVLRALLKNKEAGGSINKSMIYKIYIVDNKFIDNKNFTLEF